MRSLLFLVIVVEVSLAEVADYPFRNTSLDWNTRVDDLVYRLTLEEMVMQMAMGGGSTYLPVPAIERLGIPAYQFNTECLHGVVNLPTTAFPQSLGLSASFSEDLVYLVAEAIGTEVRATYNYASTHGDYGVYKGASCFSPFINVMRHPLWGRVQEVYGEDPFLSGRLATAYVQGMQGPDPRFVRATSGCKVVGLYSGPEDKAASRFSFNGVASERDLRLSYLPQFKACIEAGTFNLMCSFYSLNGVPGCTNKWLLTDVVRKEFGFQGYVITDWGALDFAVSQHKYYNSTLYSAAAAANAGVNLELPDSMSPVYFKLFDAVKMGLVSFETIINLVKPLFYTRMRIGEFDPPNSNPYASINTSVIESSLHRELSAMAATQTFVLLKNLNSLLPLTKTIGHLAVIGPAADDVQVILGNYAPTTESKFISLPLDGLRSLASSVDHVAGCSDMSCQQYNATAVRQSAAAADVVILCLGTGSGIEGEADDRVDMELPGHQADLLKDVIAQAKKPVILLIFSAGPVNISLAKSSPMVGAIIQCFFPGQGTGEALRRVLAVASDGSVLSPAARLPYTWPITIDQIPPMINYSMEGRTYRYFKGPGVPLYPFGYGLSYSSFQYSNLVVSPTTVKVGSKVTVQVEVTNVGSYDSDEVVQVYISWRNCPVAMPQLQLVAVRRLMIKSSATKTVTMAINEDQLRIWDDSKGFILNPGIIDVFVGGQQPGQATSSGSNVLHAAIQVVQTRKDSSRDRLRK